MSQADSLGFSVAKALAASAAVTGGLSTLIARPARASFAACGATGIGIEAALRDEGTGGASLFQVASDYVEAHAAGKAGPLVGISMSGLSVEIREMLRDAGALGEVTAFVTGGAPMEGTQANLTIDLEGVKARFLPIVACILVHGILGSPFGEELAASLPSAPGIHLGELGGFLAKAHRASLTPVFISAGKDPVTRMLSSFYMEFLKRPSFHLGFPAWTHDFLWSLGRKDAERLVLIHERPQEDLGDGRFRRALERAGSLGMGHFVLDVPPAWMARHPASSWLAWILLFYAELAGSLGIDPHREASFP